MPKTCRCFGHFLVWITLESMNDKRPHTDQTPIEAASALIQKLAGRSRSKERQIIAKKKKLITNLKGDLAKHGDPEKWKRYGDLILANLQNAIREGNKVVVTDYFDDDTPAIMIDGDEHCSLNEIAEGYFKLYIKARNGSAVIADRMKAAEAEVIDAEARLASIEKAVESGDEAYLSSLIEPPKKKILLGKKRKAEAAFKGARRFESSDGFEIMVGKKAQDNDFLTFRVARSLDTWMHAADYPGSHVVIRNPNRKEVPNRTLLEAAQLAAFYSSGREQTKAAVHYTQRKFVNKPKRSVPRLVSLSSFKTILVVPQVSVKLKD